MDVSCLNRPFDDLGLPRNRLESEAVAIIFDSIDSRRWAHWSSEIAEIEIDAIPDEERRRRVKLLLPRPENRIKLTLGHFERAAVLERMGVRPADALHLACAESCRADVFLTCDDRLLRAANRRAVGVKVRVDNPLRWLKGLEDA